MAEAPEVLQSSADVAILNLGAEGSSAGGRGAQVNPLKEDKDEQEQIRTRHLPLARIHAGSENKTPLTPDLRGEGGGRGEGGREGEEKGERLVVLL